MTVGSVRRSQLITTYGVGSMVAVEDESFMVAGLDAWPKPSMGRKTVFEPRLNISGKRLCLPPAGSPSQDHSASRDIPVVRFPDWYYCSSKLCRRLDPYGFLCSEGKNRCRHCGGALVPSRFISVCPKGHIEDFPYWQWVHFGKERMQGADRCVMRLVPNGRSGSLAGIDVVCDSCDVKRSLEGAFNKEALVSIRSCSGSRPWLIGAADEECGGVLRTTQRGASNVWFPAVSSALSIPPWSEGIQTLINDNWNTLKDLHEFPDEATRRKIIENILRNSQASFTEAEVEAAVNERLGASSDMGVEFSDIRRAEFGALRDGREGDSTSSFVAEIQDVPAHLQEFFETMTLVTRLREVRVLRGFTRLLPESETGLADLALDEDWLPAIPVHGEGLFLQFRDETMSLWEARPEVAKRAQLLGQRWMESFYANGDSAEPPTARFLLAHVFAHALINQFSLSGGYPAASIRERIYDQEEGTGILIYAAGSDSSGSLGGLIAQAKAESLEINVREALGRYQWCSSDPVCAETTSQGVDGLNMAACHACALLPETSCEYQNTLLDRFMLIGSLEGKEDGFFAPILGQT